jgi:predicted dehydrogenase
MGLVGAGFVGPHHVDAVRRLGYVDIVAVAGSNDASGRQKAEALGARRGYGSYQALLDDPEVDVVHNATPNHLHYAVTSAALAKGKHVVSDKPLAMTAAESKKRGAPESSTPSPSTIAATRSCSRHATRSRAATSAPRTSSTATTCRTGS